MIGITRYIVVGIIGLSVCFERIGAMEFRDQQRHFTIQIPDDWVQMSPAQLASANELSKAQYFTGFRPVSKSEKTTFVLLDFAAINLNRRTSEELAQGLANRFNISVHPVKNVSISSQVNMLRDGLGVFDTKKNRGIVRFEKGLPDGRCVFTFSYSMAGKEGIVWLLCRTTNVDLDRDLLTFNDMADSFEYDEAFRLEPPKQQFLTLGLVVSLFSCVLVGLVAVGWLIKRNRNRQTNHVQ